jgi:hypothetical protein
LLYIYTNRAYIKNGTKSSVINLPIKLPKLKLISSY